MINAVRREPFVLDILFDRDANALRDFTLSFRQRGRTIIRKRKSDAEIAEDGQRAYVELSKKETALFEAYDPVYAQVCTILADGEELHSETAEINVVDVLDAQEEEK